MLHTLHQTGSRECSTLTQQVHAKLDKAQQMLESIKIGQRADAGWDPSTGCLPRDRCVEKMDVLVSKMQKVVISFKENRQKRILNNNDEQIHRFEKYVA